MATGAELFVWSLKQLGIGEIFTLVGDHLNDVLAVAAAAGIRIVDMRHESGVTHAADAHARINRRPALSLVTGGPGHTNSLTGIATAYLAASPLIAVSGSRSTAVADRGGFQDIDQVGMAAPVVKWAAQPPSAGAIPFYLARAFNEANTGRKGPVHLTIPVDVFTGEAKAIVPMPQTIEQAHASPDPRQVEQILGLLRGAQWPVVIAGSGVWWGEAERELKQFIELTSLPLYTITMARGLVADDHPLCFGYADPALNRGAHEAFQEADLFLVLGKRIDYRLGLGGRRVIPAAAKCIQVDIHPQELGMNRALEVAICGDVRATLQALISAVTEPWMPLPWLDRVRALRDEWLAYLDGRAAVQSIPLHPAAFYSELNRLLPRDTLYSWDGGDFIHWGRAITPALEHGGWLRLGPLGTIGSALPNAIAMKLNHPDRPVVMITGDGALGFYIAEIDTAVRHKLSFIIVVGNDSGWGLERELQQAATGSSATVGCELRSTRYDLIMKGFGGDGETIDTLDQLGPAVERALNSSVPYCLNVNIRGVRSPFTEWQISGKSQK
jgi:acetolactate synthase-1/2/3 large subunit